MSQASPDTFHLMLSMYNHYIGPWLKNQKAGILFMKKLKVQFFSSQKSPDNLSPYVYKHCIGPGIIIFIKRVLLKTCMKYEKYLDMVDKFPPQFVFCLTQWNTKLFFPGSETQNICVFRKEGKYLVYWIKELSRLLSHKVNKSFNSWWRPENIKKTNWKHCKHMTQSQHGHASDLTLRMHNSGIWKYWKG